MEETRIRTVTKEDLPAIQKIEHASFKDPYPKAFMEYLYHTNKSTFFTAESKGEIAGYIIASQEDSMGHIIAIATQQSERRKHIGTKLMEAIIEIFLKSKIPTIRLEVRKNNIEAQKFYEKLGFKYSYTIEGYYGDEDGLVYYKSL
ncbi:MAG: [ribosomal protein S18]-alanine N-acetyltransferase [Thermoproteota archaeon]|nr:[ribosomal protein S18]-alanine N-acetyltransferase [Thermoproteota archaeon]